MATAAAHARMAADTRTYRRERPDIRVYRKRKKPETDWERFCRLLKRKMKQVLRRNMAKIVLVGLPLLGVLAGIFIGMKVTAYTQATKINDYGRLIAYTTYTVRSGDTVWGIAQDLAALNPEYNDIRQYVSAIMSINQISGESLRSGDTILIPYYINIGGMNQDEIRSKYGIEQ